MSQALQEIREAIRKGKLKPGDRLVETQLAEEMYISRFPIREALRYLEKEGLVEYGRTLFLEKCHRGVCNTDSHQTYQCGKD
jgi:DNA-binding GntR family transcriptional regulator